MLKIALSYLLIYTVWGSTYLFIRIAVQELPPFFIIGTRFLTGGILLGIYCLFKGYLSKPPSLLQIRNSVLTGTLLLAGGNGLITLAQKNVNSYISALIVALTPITVLLFDRILFRKEIARSGWWGAVLGIVGVSILLLKGEGTFGVQLTPQILIIFGGMVLWALGTSLSKQLQMPQNSIVNACIQLTFIGAVFSLSALFVTPVDYDYLKSVSVKSLGSVVYLTVFGTLALVSYSYLLYKEPSRRIVTYTLVNPLIAVFLGIVLAKETSVPFLIPGTVLILSGLALMFYGPRLFKSKIEKSPV